MQKRLAAAATVVLLAPSLVGCQIGARIRLPKPVRTERPPSVVPSPGSTGIPAAPPPRPSGSRLRLPSRVEWEDGLSIDEALALRRSQAPPVAADAGVRGRAAGAGRAGTGERRPGGHPSAGVGAGAEGEEDLESAAERIERADAERTVFAEVRSAYYAVLGAERRLERACNEEGWLGRLVATTLAASPDSRGLDKDAALVEDAHRRAARECASLREGLLEERARLASLLGAAPRANFALTSDFPPRLELPPRSELLARALAERGDLVAARLRERATIGDSGPAPQPATAGPQALEAHVRATLGASYGRVLQAVGRVEYYERILQPEPAAEPQRAGGGTSVAEGPDDLREALRKRTEAARCGTEYLEALLAYAEARVGLDTAVGAVGAADPMPVCDGEAEYRSTEVGGP
ncbi:MAG: TolC family protein [Planctomycetes bacterium]|nr:TolC family protein [Planctomycetota bacterium]